MQRTAASTEVERVIMITGSSGRRRLSSPTSREPSASPSITSSSTASGVERSRKAASSAALVTPRCS